MIGRCALNSQKAKKPAGAVYNREQSSNTKYFEVEQRTDGHLESFTNDYILPKALRALQKAPIFLNMNGRDGETPESHHLVRSSGGDRRSPVRKTKKHLLQNPGKPFSILDN